MLPPVDTDLLPGLSRYRPPDVLPPPVATSDWSLSSPVLFLPACCEEVNTLRDTRKTPKPDATALLMIQWIRHQAHRREGKVLTLFCGLFVACSFYCSTTSLPSAYFCYLPTTCAQTTYFRLPDCLPATMLLHGSLSGITCFNGSSPPSTIYLLELHTPAGCRRLPVTMFYPDTKLYDLPREE